MLAKSADPINSPSATRAGYAIFSYSTKIKKTDFFKEMKIFEKKDYDGLSSVLLLVS
jgi:hypothetical protein